MTSLAVLAALFYGLFTTPVSFLPSPPLSTLQDKESSGIQITNVKVGDNRLGMEGWDRTCVEIGMALKPEKGVLGVGSWSLTVNLQDGDMLEAHQSEGQIARSRSFCFMMENYQVFTVPDMSLAIGGPFQRGTGLLQCDK